MGQHGAAAKGPGRCHGATWRSSKRPLGTSPSSSSKMQYKPIHRPSGMGSDSLQGEH